MHYEIWRDTNYKAMTCGEFHSALKWLITHAKDYDPKVLTWIDTMAGCVITLQVKTPKTTTFYRIIRCEESGNVTNAT